MRSDESSETDSVVRWQLVYAAVVAFTAAVAALLYLFSYWFTG